MAISIRSLTLAPNTDGTYDSEYPNGDKSVGDTLAWNLLGFPTLTGLSTGTPFSHNVRQYLTGTLAATATITIVNDSGDDAATEGWAISGNNLIHPGDNTGSGAFHLRAAEDALTANGPGRSWAYATPVPTTPVDYEYVASEDGLDNGSGEGNWTPFNSATLNADPASDGYLQVTFPTGADWGGVSAHGSVHGEPTFQSGAEFSVEIVVASSTTVTDLVAQIGNGSPVSFTSTAGTKNLTLVAGNGDFVIYSQGGGGSDEVLRLTSLSIDGSENVFNFSQSSYTVNEDQGTLEVAVLRNSPDDSAVTVDVVKTAGADSVAVVADTTLSWSADEGGTKFSTLTLAGAGSATLELQNESAGAIGTVSETDVTVQASAGGEIPFPRLGMLWIGGGDLGTQTTMYQTAQGIENMRRRHVVIMGQWPELQGFTGVTHESVASAVKAASTIGTRMFIYMDQDGVYKDSYTSSYATKRAKMESENWYVYASGASGTPLDSYFHANSYTINNTAFAPQDSSGKRAIEWMLDNEWGWMREGGNSNAAAPSIDGIYMDNVINSPRINGDWNRTGGVDSANAFSPPWNVTPKTWYRAGIQTGVQNFKAAHTGIPVLGNLEFVNVANGGSDLPEYDQTFNGGTFEAVMGFSHAYETWMGTSTLVARLQNAEDMLLEPALGIVTGNPSDFSATNYQEFRHFYTYVLVFTNMSVGFCRNTQAWGNWDWYDEYDFTLGAASESRQAYAGGPVRRDFTNGIAICWPKDSAGSAVSLGGTFYALQGNASGWLTPGQAVTSVTPSSTRNGIILSRTPT